MAAPAEELPGGLASSKDGYTFTVAGPTYRLFLDFRHGGVVRTAEFTVTTAGTPAAPAPAVGHGH